MKLIGREYFTFAIKDKKVMCERFCVPHYFDGKTEVDLMNFFYSTLNNCKIEVVNVNTYGDFQYVNFLKKELMFRYFPKTESFHIKISIGDVIYKQFNNSHKDFMINLLKPLFKDQIKNIYYF